jgi:hypothetical protein
MSHPSTGFYCSRARTKPDARAGFVGHAGPIDRQRRLAMKHSMKIMWVCVAVIGVVAILAATGSGVGYLLFALPCALMMGAMMWMMMRGGMGGGSSGQR